MSQNKYLIVHGHWVDHQWNTTTHGHLDPNTELKIIGIFLNIIRRRKIRQGWRIWYSIFLVQFRILPSDFYHISVEIVISLFTAKYGVMGKCIDVVTPFRCVTCIIWDTKLGPRCFLTAHLHSYILVRNNLFTAFF